MTLRIDPDPRRFRDIVRGKIRQNLRKYISNGELIGRKGKDAVSIPVPQIEVPRFRFGGQDQGGVGQGPGKVGDTIGQGQQEGDGSGKAGSEAGEHVLEVELSLEELADILGEELSLPRIQPKGKERLISQKDRYVGIRRTGPESLRHFKRTFRQALRRQLMMGKYDPKLPMVVPIREDRRYRSWKTVPMRHSNAVMIFIMDVSGSMGDEQKEIVRIETFWIDTWLRRHYPGIESRYIIHDATARDVDRETFFRTRESGGTMISSAYRLAAEIIRRHYPTSEWNVYPFHFSDGDNWSMDDTLTCVALLKDELLDAVNMFGYGQVESPYGSGQFIKDLKEHLGNDERLVTSEIHDRDGIVRSIQDLLGKGE
jgi:sporulation protein YhbH